MHSVILTLSREDNGGNFTQTDIDDYDMDKMSFADYIRELTPKEADEWCQFLREVPGIEYNEERHSIKVLDKEEFFREKFEKFEDALEKVREEASFAKYVNGSLWYELYKLNECFDRTGGTRVDWDQEYMGTFYAFIRGAEIGTEYFIRGVVDYHY